MLVIAFGSFGVLGTGSQGNSMKVGVRAKVGDGGRIKVGGSGMILALTRFISIEETIKALVHQHVGHLRWGARLCARWGYTYQNFCPSAPNLTTTTLGKG